MNHPDGHDLSLPEQRDLLAAYGIELWETIPVATLKEARAAGKKLGWDVVLKATAHHLRHRPDLAHVRRNIDGPAEMNAVVGVAERADHRARAPPASWCRRTRRPACPSGSPRWRTRSSGR